MPRTKRRPTHAGSWYSSDESELGEQVNAWLNEVPGPQGKAARAIIAPHAGYRYSGRVMAYAYKHINPSQVSHIFLLGPSHHVYTQHCALSSASAYSTPMGDIDIDTEIYEHLQSSGMFEVMNLKVDEAEHSLELHLPYIAAVMGQRPFTLVPIMVGALAPQSEAHFGQLLAPYLEDPRNVFVVSSDFCHWGSRFGFTFHDKSKGAIYESIQWLDRIGMDTIEEMDPTAFQAYMQQYANTICGRHPIAILLNMLRHCRQLHRVNFVKYAQSSRCTRVHDSSVSYAAAVVTTA